MLALLLGFAAAPVLAQSDAEFDASVDNVLGDHAVYRAAFDAIQQAVTDGDAAAFAQWVSYPISVMADGEQMNIETEQQFVEHYDNIITDEIRGAILDQTWATMMVNSDGIMFSSGQVWLNGICKDEGCAAFDVKIITIQSAS